MLPFSVYGIDNVQLQLRWYHQFQFAGYYVAKDLGFYKELGINVEIKPGYPGLIPVDELHNGNVNFAIDNSGLIAKRAEGHAINALAAIFQKDSLRLISLKSNKISEIDHLAGKRIMLESEYGSLSLLALLTKYGLLNKIERLNSSHDIQDLLNNNTDAFNGYASNEPYTLEKQGIPYNVITPSEYGIEFYSDILFTKEQLVKSNPQLVANFTTASLRGWEYAMNNVEEAIEITKRYATTKDLDHLRFEAITMQKLILSDFIDVGQMSHQRWGKIQNHLINIGMIKSPIEIENFIFDVHAYNTRSELNNNWIIVIVIISILSIFTLIYLFIRNFHLVRTVEKSKDELVTTYNMATHDSLTNLPNRLLLTDRIDQALLKLPRSNETPLVGFIDLDNFKPVNDTYGHDMGDKLLRLIAENVSDVIRPNDTFSRIGGDEFIYLAENACTDEIEEIGQRISLAIMASVNQINIQVEVTASIGFLLIHSSSNLDAAKVIKLTDLEMYEVKKQEKNGMSFSEYFG
ncbi:MAG: GGDEF domain-containing protein [Gammaproteobacteria bacterium]|nr:GGDEF domain-containing protein [Gammaproteobacteria bacterium]